MFEVFTRRLPEGRRYGVTAGTGRVLDAVEAFRFTPEQLAFLERAGVVDRPTLDWLETYRKFWEASFTRLDALLEILQTPINAPDQPASKRKPTDA